MQTTQDRIRERLNLLPETKLREVLLFVDFLVSRLGFSAPPPLSSSFGDALHRFRLQIETEGSDIEEADFFQEVRDRSPTPMDARW